MINLQTLSPSDLYDLKKQVEDRIADLYWEDDNFQNREEHDGYIYIIVYNDLTYYFDFIGKRAYNRYLTDKNAIRIECKTKDLFPEYKLLMSKGELNGQEELRC